MKNTLVGIIEEKKDVLESGEAVTVLLNDAYVTIYNEIDEKTQNKKTVTLIDSWDLKIDFNLAELINA
jgi:ribonucleotide reductase alpha subunit